MPSLTVSSNLNSKQLRFHGAHPEFYYSPPPLSWLASFSWPTWRGSPYHPQLHIKRIVLDTNLLNVSWVVEFLICAHKISLILPKQLMDFKEISLFYELT